MPRTPKPWYREDRQAYFVTINGKRHNLGSDKAEADRRFHALMARKDEALVVPAKNQQLTVAEVLDKFLSWCQTHREPRTYSGYVTQLQSFLDFNPKTGHLPAESIRPFHVIEWVDSHKKWNPTTRRNAIIAIQRPFNWAYKLGYIDNNALRHIEKPKAERRDNPMPPDHFAKMLAEVKDQQFRDLLEFAWETGCRPQEARHIEIRHIQATENGTRIVIPPTEAKGRKRYRIIRLTAKAAEIVSRRSKGRSEGKLFLNTDGKPWKTFAICCRFTRLKKKLGKGYACYDLRHSFAERMLEAGNDHLTVAELMGHSNGIMLASVYQHLNRADDHLDAALRKAGTPLQSAQHAKA